MYPHPPSFVLPFLLTLLTILLVVGIRSFSAARLARLQTTREDAYHDMARKSVQAQDATNDQLSALRTDLFEVKTRLAAVEKMLREVA